MGKENARNGKATMDNYGELQSQQPTLEGNKALSQYSTLTSNPKHERCVHFHSHYKPQIYFNNTARSLEPANCSAKQRQWHFKGSQRVFDGILMLSGFGGISEESMASWQL